MSAILPPVVISNDNESGWSVPLPSFESNTIGVEPDEHVEVTDTLIAVNVCDERACSLEEDSSRGQPCSLEVPPGFDLSDKNVNTTDTEDTDEGPWTPGSPQCGFQAPPRKMSDVTFCNPEQTFIIFDWDDTLCPSSACFEGHGMTGAQAPPLGSSLEQELQRLAEDIKAVLERASQLAGAVAIVTNGGERWVDLSAQAWMPAVVPVLKDVRVSSARARWESQGISSPTGWKTHEFQDVIEKFYSQYEDQSWKNIVCIGDAPYEHEALRRVVDESRSSHCRTKSIKFLTKPSIEDVGYQVRKLATYLEDVVVHDGDLDIDFRIPFHFGSAVME